MHYLLQQYLWGVVNSLQLNSLTHAYEYSPYSLFLLEAQPAKFYYHWQLTALSSEYLSLLKMETERQQ